MAISGWQIDNGKFQISFHSELEHLFVFQINYSLFKDVVVLSNFLVTLIILYGWIIRVMITFI